MAVGEEEATRLFDCLIEEAILIFYVKTSVEFGALGAPDE
jgi:hypothetical protein